MKKKFRLAKSVAIAYFVYSMVTDIAIWTTALLYFITVSYTHLTLPTTPYV